MNDKLDLLLVNPGNRTKIYGDLHEYAGIAPPIGIGLLAAFVRKQGNTVKIMDAEARNWNPEYTVKEIIKQHPLLVGISAYTTKMTSAGKILTLLKKEAPHIKTIIGGSHSSALPEQTLLEEDTDFVCKGEGFYPLVELLAVLKSGNYANGYSINGLWYLRDNKVISNSPSQLFENLDKLPFVAWDLLPMEKYRAHHWHCWNDIERRKPYAVIYTSLGCPFKCSFCSVNVVYGKSGFRHRSPENVLEELDLLINKYNIKNIEIVDDTFTVKKDRVRKICDLIIERGYNLNLWCYARVDTVDKPLLHKLKQAGFNWIAYGIEAGNKSVLNNVLRKTNFNQIKRAIDMTREADIHMVGNYIFGLPEDDTETMNSTLDLATRINAEWANFYSAMAYPGTELYKNAINKNIPLPQKWEEYGQYTEGALPVSTKYLQGSEVLQFRDKAFKTYYSNTEYIKTIKEKFGKQIADYVGNMLKHDIRRHN